MKFSETQQQAATRDIPYMKTTFHYFSPKLERRNAVQLKLLLSKDVFGVFDHFKEEYI